jgi:hypothetical protein
VYRDGSRVVVGVLCGPAEWRMLYVHTYTKKFVRSHPCTRSHDIHFSCDGCCVVALLRRHWDVVVLIGVLSVP